MIDIKNVKVNIEKNDIITNIIDFLAETAVKQKSHPTWMA